MRGEEKPPQLPPSVRGSSTVQVWVEPRSRPAPLVWIGPVAQERPGPLSRVRVEGRRDEPIHSRGILDRRVFAADADAVFPPADRPPPPARNFWTEFSIAIGFAGLAIMGMQFLITARVHHISAPYGMDIMYHFHR
jgi:hypothetical protein